MQVSLLSKRIAQTSIMVSVLFCCLVLHISSASAAGVEYSGEVDLQILNEKLSTDPTLANYNSYSAADRLAIQRAIAWEDYIGNTFVGESTNTMEAGLSTTFRTAADSGISSYETSLVNGTSALSDTGSTTAAIGGELADEAVVGGWVGPAALLPLAGTLVYQDITTGENSVYTALFGPKEDYFKVKQEEIGLESDVPAEKLDWVYFPDFTGCTQAFNVCAKIYEQQEDHCKDGRSAWKITNWVVEGGEQCTGESTESFNVTNVGRFGEPYNATRLYNAYNATEEFPVVGEPRRLFFLEVKEEGKWYLGAKEARNEAEEEPKYGAGISTKLTGWMTANKACQIKGGGQAADPNVLGYPSSVGPEILNSKGQSQFCTGPGRVDKYNTLTLRAPSRMHVGLPRHLTKAQREALEAEGNTFTNLTGSTAPTVKTATPKLTKAAKEHGWKKHEEANKHFFESGPEGKETPETPLPGTQEIPSCTFIQESGSECAQNLRNDGFSSVELDPLTWETAVITKPANAAIRTEPKEGSRVETSTKINVIENPDESGMPVFVPVPGKSETGTEYKSRTESQGWTDVKVEVLPSPDPSAGPDDVVSTSPTPDTRLDPRTSPKTNTSVKVKVNPPESPHTPHGGPDLPGFHFPNFGVLCEGFPFGVPCWIAKTIEGWSAVGKAPVWGLENVSFNGHKIDGLRFDLKVLEPVMEKLRPFMLILATIGLVLLFYRFAKGGSPPSGGGSGEGAGGGSDEEHHGWGEI